MIRPRDDAKHQLQKKNNFSEMAGPVVLVTSASGRIGKEVIARLKSLGRFVDLTTS